MSTAGDIEYIPNTEVFTIATAGYAPFTLNLCASLDSAGIRSNIIVYTPDRSLYEVLLSKGIRTVHLENIDLPSWSDHRGQDFNLIVALKFAIALDIFQSGRNALFVDGDIVFLRDPREYLKSIIDNSTSDMIMQYEIPKEDYNTGFWFARPNQNVINIFREVRNSLVVDSKFDCDQFCFNEKLRDFENLKLEKLDVELFACGNQFLGDLTDASEAIDRTQIPFPFDRAFILHFNYLVGRRNKIKAIEKLNAVYYAPLAGLAEEATSPAWRRFVQRIAGWCYRL